VQQGGGYLFSDIYATFLVLGQIHLPTCTSAVLKPQMFCETDETDTKPLKSYFRYTIGPKGGQEGYIRTNSTMPHPMVHSDYILVHVQVQYSLVQ
jgi:hypothetical protein